MDGGEVTSPEALEGLTSRTQSLPDRFDELPLELLSFTDRSVFPFSSSHSRADPIPALLIPCP